MTASKGSNELSPVHNASFARAPLDSRAPVCREVGARAHDKGPPTGRVGKRGPVRGRRPPALRRRRSIRHFQNVNTANAASPSTTVIQSIRPCGTNATWARGIEMESMSPRTAPLSLWRPPCRARLRDREEDRGGDPGATGLPTTGPPVAPARIAAACEDAPPGRTTYRSCRKRCADRGRTALRLCLDFALRGGV